MSRRRGSTIPKVRRSLYRSARILGDVQAVRTGRVSRRIALVALGAAMLLFIAVFSILTVMRARRSDGALDVTSRQSLDSYVDARHHTPADTERYDSRKD